MNDFETKSLLLLGSEKILLVNLPSYAVAVAVFVLVGPCLLVGAKEYTFARQMAKIRRT
jgi:hypothetical protein